MFDLQTGPRIFDIPSGEAFAEVFARGIIDRVPPDDPFALSEITILAPTRRGARTIADAMVRYAGRPILTPRILTLAAIDDIAPPATDLPPAIDPMRRLAILTRLVHSMTRAMPELGNEATAVSLAQALASLIDQAQSERLSLDALGEIVPEDHAQHWAQTLQFLDILRNTWPEILAARGVMDPVARRAALIERTAASWQATPPQKPFIVAGSTGSVRLSAELICAIAHLPQGAVVLPGLDNSLDSGTFRTLADTPDHAGQPEHPQNGLSRLLNRLGNEDGPVSRSAVKNWAGITSPRSSFVSLALRPAPVTDSWMKEGRDVMRSASEALSGVALIETETPQEEAHVIAIAMREALADPDRSVALVTTDRTLSRRVVSILKRWNITPDDSAGVPLPGTPPGTFLRLVTEYVFAQQRSAGPQNLDPIPLLAMLKHPLCRLGGRKGESVGFVRRIERRAMRAEHATGAALDKVRAVFEQEAERFAETLAWLDRFEAALAPIQALPDGEVEFAEALKALMATLHALCIDDNGQVPLWEGPNGAALEGFLTELQGVAEEFGPVSLHAIPAMLMTLMAGRTARAPFGQHPRAAIWGTLEARMQTADRVILAGLNEDNWPRLPENDPWMSRGMRRSFGLAPLERRIGLAAHDFEQAICARDVILTRARKQDGTPTVPSRWLQRIVTLLGEEEGKGFAPDVLHQMRAAGDVYRDYAAGLTTSDQETRPCARPAPTPPVTARPKRLSVTQIETLIRDPYAIYARHVLKLKKLDPLTPEPDARTRGQIMHAIVEEFIRRTIKGWPVDPAERRRLFAECIDAALAPLDAWPSFQMLYRARAERVMDWFIAEEDARRAVGGAPLALEAVGKLDVEIGTEVPFELVARVDRIDRLPGVAYALYDYKGSTSPTEKQVKAEWAQQLPLQAAMLEKGGFALEPGPVHQIAYIKLMGGAKIGEEIPITEPAPFIAEALPNLTNLLRAYLLPDTPYLSRARPDKTDWESDYDHLARYGEWVSGEGTDAK